MGVARRIETPAQAIKRLEREIESLKGLAVATRGAAGHYVLLGEDVAPGGSQTLLVDNLSQDYAMLFIEFTGDTEEGSATLSNLMLRFNGDSGNNYRWSHMYVDAGGTVTGSGLATASHIRAGFVSNLVGSTNMNATVMNYTNPSSSKTVTFNCFSTIGAADAATRSVMGGGRWVGPSITAVQLLPAGTTFESGSVLRVYGVGKL